MTVPEKATREQIEFLGDRWCVVDHLLDAPEEMFKSKEQILAGLSKTRASELIAKFRRARKDSERQLYECRKAVICANCRHGRDGLDGCEMPSLFQRAGECPCWSPDPTKLACTYEHFRRDVQGKLCSLRVPDGQTWFGRPFDYLPHDGMFVRLEPSQAVRVFEFGTGVHVEVLE